MGSRKADKPLFEQVKNHIVQKISTGKLRPGDRVQSEHELVEALKVSRMTANRALRELAAGGVLFRVAGVGTFVAEPKAEGHLLEVINIAEEIRERGHAYSNAVLKHERTTLPRDIARTMGLSPGAPIYRTLMVHLEQKIPIQLEDRYVNILVAPAYTAIDLERDTPSQYLLENFPLKKVQHTVRAALPDKQVRKHLKMTAGTPCLVLERLTWSNNVPVSYAVLYHSADSYVLSETFSPK
jgi:GntR family histidine utilization transcriptional repressor